MSQHQHSAQRAAAPTATAFATWLQSHPAQIYLLATVDYASNRLLALETFLAAKMPTVLAAAMAPADAANWQAIGPNAFKRVDFTPLYPSPLRNWRRFLCCVMSCIHLFLGKSIFEMHQQNGFYAKSRYSPSKKPKKHPSAGRVLGLSVVRMEQWQVQDSSIFFAIELIGLILIA